MTPSKPKSAPREWWIRPQKGTDCDWTNLELEDDSINPRICVIERSYATELEREIERLKSLERLDNTVIEQLRRADAASIKIQADKITSLSESLRDAFEAMNEYTKVSQSAYEAGIKYTNLQNACNALKERHPELCK